jgi:hypothetical protein
MTPRVAGSSVNLIVRGHGQGKKGVRMEKRDEGGKEGEKKGSG